ncbi:HU family DNA-binding protein [Fusobacterium varium]|uniref:HU family DNA-binding protein n=1 Tax=Fusobacterium TaxID=848 RepID=UPI001031B276|nr:HU family DNA-binding protein [Fusobacterium ulcerans]
MKESDFIKLYKKKIKAKNYKETKKKVDLFWNAFFKLLDNEKKIVIKNWGIFEKKSVKSRKVVVPMWIEAGYSKPKEIIKFRAGEGLIKKINKSGENNE